MSAILTVRGLDAWYGDLQVLREVCFEIEAGGVTALLGANGAGKTTVLRALSGTIRRHGEIMFTGQRIDRMAAEDIVRLRVAHAPEGRGTFGSLTVAENLQLGAVIRRDAGAIRADIDRCYSYFPILKERRNQQAGMLSGGEQQMLAIARALMLRPKLMLLDEPSVGLAPMMMHRIFDILGELKHRLGTAMLIVEQNASLALELADRAYLIETGTIVMSGDARTIAADECVRASYLGY